MFSSIKQSSKLKYVSELEYEQYNQITIHNQINYKIWAKQSLEFIESVKNESFCITVYIRKAITYSPAASA